MIGIIVVVILIIVIFICSIVALLVLLNVTMIRIISFITIVTVYNIPHNPAPKAKAPILTPPAYNSCYSRAASPKRPRQPRAEATGGGHDLAIFWADARMDSL